jgi:flagellar hook protein FlgE
MAFQQGLSGLYAAAKALDVTSNNVANSATVGFKSAQAHFADVFAASLGGGGGSQVGIGTSVGAIQQQFTQGNITTTNNPLDISINGGGFYRMSNNGTITYSRAGQFHLDKDGYVVDDRARKLTGYLADTGGTIVQAAPAELKLSSANQDPVATGSTSGGGVKASLNFDSRSTVPSTSNGAVPPVLTPIPFSINAPASYNFSTATAIYDTLGNAHTMTIYAVKTSNTVATVASSAAATAQAALDSTAKTAADTAKTDADLATASTLAASTAAGVTSAAVTAASTPAVIAAAAAAALTAANTAVTVATTAKASTAAALVAANAAGNTTNIANATTADTNAGLALTDATALQTAATTANGAPTAPNTAAAVAAGTLAVTTATTAATSATTSATTATTVATTSTALATALAYNLANPTLSQWLIYSAIDGTSIDNVNGGVPMSLGFNTSGQLTAAAPSGGFDVSIDLNSVMTENSKTNIALSPQAFTLDFASSTQFGAAFGTNSLQQDGYTSGRLTGVNVGTDGVVRGNYSNGQAKDLGQVVLTSFTNPNGLTSLGGNQWAETSASGAALVGAPNTGTLGVLQSAAVEESNTDLTAELVNMITEQRNYQANAQSIKTQDQILQTLVNLR